VKFDINALTCDLHITSGDLVWVVDLEPFVEGFEGLWDLASGVGTPCGSNLGIVVPHVLGVSVGVNTTTVGFDHIDSGSNVAKTSVLTLHLDDFILVVLGLAICELDSEAASSLSVWETALVTFGTSLWVQVDNHIESIVGHSVQSLYVIFHGSVPGFSSLLWLCED